MKKQNNKAKYQWGSQTDDYVAKVKALAMLECFDEIYSENTTVREAGTDIL